MLRMKLVRTGKFFLIDYRRRVYLHQKGAYDDGRGSEPYIHWTPYFDGAMSFNTIKRARAMQRRMREAGFTLSIIDRDGRFVDAGRQ